MLFLAFIFFWVAFIALFVIWIGYPMVLWLLTRLLPSRFEPGEVGTSDKGSNDRLSIIIAAHNEEDVIEQRLQNMLDVAPADFDYEVIVMSDHSQDKTVALVEEFASNNKRFKVYETTDQRGRAAAHNQSIRHVNGDILIFTDAETEFAPDFLDIVGHAFDDEEVGYVSGKLSWRNRSGGVTGENFSLYWRFEVWLRQLETHLGICAVGTGACCALRKSLFRPIPLSSDVDCSTPLDVVLQGSRSVFVPEAVAIDYVAETASNEFRARVRMTSKNFDCTVGLWDWAGFFRRPGVSTGLALHKLGRWLTPFFALVLLACGTIAVLAGEGGVVSFLTILGWLAIVLALLGALVPSAPLLGSLWSFLLANISFAAGVIKALANRTPQHY